MSLWKIAWRSIQQRTLSSTLTAVSMGLGVALVVAVLVIQEVIEHSFCGGGYGYDLIVGKKGDSLDLVLNAAYYLRRPIGDIPAGYRDELLEGHVAPEVGIEAAIPICMGHSFRGFRVVGTVPEMFTQLLYGDGQQYEFAEGENFQPQNHLDAVIGWTVHLQTRLEVGSTFKALHGVEEGSREHGKEFKVVGILARTGTPADRALFVNMEGFFTIHDEEQEQEQQRHAAEDPAAKEHAAEEQAAEEHAAEAQTDHAGENAHDHGDHAHGSARSITALLVCVDQSQPGMAGRLKRAIDGSPGVTPPLPEAQAVFPMTVMTELFEGILGDVQVVLLIMAVLIVVVAGMGIMVSIYNSMSDRRHDIAVMRALGAGRLTVMAVILLESILLSLGGGAIGLLLGHGLIGALSPLIVERTGVAVSLLQFQWTELWLIPGLIALASLVGYLPAVAAYRTDVAQSLSATP